MGNVFGVDGIVSGLETSTLIKAMLSRQQTIIDKLEAQQTSYENEANAWREVNTSVLNLKTAVYKMQSFMTFKDRSTSVSNENVLTATASVGAAKGTYNIEVLNTAKAHTLASDGIASVNPALGAGTIKVNGVAIEITSGDNLNTIAEKINNSEAGVNVSVIQVNSDNYKMVFTSEASGTENAMTFQDDNGILSSLGILDAEGNINEANQVQAAEDAVFKMNGITITRSDNEVTDVVAGVTFNLKNAAVGTVAQVKVKQDVDGIVESAQDFVDQYNETMTLISDYLHYDKETKTAGVLNGDSSLMRLQSQIRGFINNTVAGVDPSVSTMSLVGISTGAFGSSVENTLSGTLQLDEAKLRKALETNYDDVAILFGASSVNIAATKLGANAGIVTEDGLGGSTTVANNSLIDGDTATTGVQVEVGSWVEIQLAKSSVVDQINIYTAAGDETYGLNAFDVEYWDSKSSSWVNLLSVTGNNGDFYSAEFAATKTDKIRVKVNEAANGGTYAELFEIEVLQQNSGVFAKMNDALYTWTTTGGTIDSKVESFQERIKDLDDQIERKEALLAQRETYLYAKFTAMEKALAQLETQTSALDSLIASMNSNKDK